MQEQHQNIQELLEEYADCFALSIKEVNMIPGTVHKLNIPEGAMFHTKIPPRSYGSMCLHKHQSKQDAGSWNNTVDTPQQGPLHGLDGTSSKITQQTRPEHQGAQI